MCEEKTAVAYRLGTVLFYSLHGTSLPRGPARIIIAMAIEVETATVMMSLFLYVALMRQTAAAESSCSHHLITISLRTHLDCNHTDSSLSSMSSSSSSNLYRVRQKRPRRMNLNFTATT